VRFAALSLAILAMACKPAPPTLDPNAEVIARQFFEEVRNGDDLDADPHLAHELKNPTTEAQIAQFRSMIPQDPPRSIELRTWDAKAESIGTTTRLTEAYGYGDHTLIAQFALFKSPSGQEPVIVGFNLSDEPGEGS
jgi:hypothetical protein